MGIFLFVGHICVAKCDVISRFTSHLLHTKRDFEFKKTQKDIGKGVGVS